MMHFHKSTYGKPSQKIKLGVPSCCHLNHCYFFRCYLQVHVRIASPPIKHPCYMGINIPTKTELIANRVELEKLAEHFGLWNKCLLIPWYSGPWYPQAFLYYDFVYWTKLSMETKFFKRMELISIVVSNMAQLTRPELHGLKFSWYKFYNISKIIVSWQIARHYHTSTTYCP